MQIEIDFEVYKALTSRRHAESHSYNDVLRELLNLPPVEPQIHPDSAAAAMARAGAALSKGWTSAPKNMGFHSRGLFLPEGTQLRASYKNATYSARIFRGEWCHPDGTKHESPSAAATAITCNKVNGLRFWEALRPGDTEYRKLDVIRELDG